VTAGAEPPWGKGRIIPAGLLPWFMAIVAATPRRSPLPDRPADPVLETGLGFLVLAAERLRGTSSSSAVLRIGVGLVALGREAGGRAAGQVSGAVDWCVRRAARVPGFGLVGAPVAEAGRAIGRAADTVQDKGREVMNDARDRALRVLRTNIDDATQWAERELLPVVVPHVIDDAVPQIREQVLPLIVADLTNDPRVRELVVQTSRGALGDVTQEIRDRAVDADDKLETVARRLFPHRVKRGAAPEGA
jgi:hypothetical protein